MSFGNVEIGRRSQGLPADITNETGTLVQPDSLDNIILDFLCPVQSYAEITHYLQAWDQSLDTYLSHYLMIDGVIVWPRYFASQIQIGGIPTYRGSKVQIGMPDEDTPLPSPIKVGWGHRIQMGVDVAAGATAGLVTGRIVVKFYDKE